MNTDVVIFWIQMHDAVLMWDYKKISFKNTIEAQGENIISRRPRSGRRNNQFSHRQNGARVEYSLL